MPLPRPLVLPFALVLAIASGVSQTLSIDIEEAKVEGRAARSLYGVNVFRGFDDRIATNAEYQKVVRSLGAEILRFHNGGMYKDGSKSWMDANWVDLVGKKWNREKIGRIVRAFEGAGARRLMTLTGWPPWMNEKESDRLDESMEDAFAAWCAELVRIVNVENRGGVSHWEILNEMDLRKSYGGDITSLARAVEKAAAAMKKVDPAVKTTGNAWAWAPQKTTEAFVTLSPGAHDFFSYHSYTVNEATPSQATLREKAPRIAAGLDRLAALPALLGKEIWLDEWNMFGSYRQDEKTRHMSSPEAAVYDLVIYRALAARSTAEPICAWNECDGAYGKIANDFTVREAGRLMAAMNARFTGEVLATRQDDEGKAILFAVRGAGGVALAIGNPTDAALGIDLSRLEKRYPRRSLLLRDDKNRETVESLEAGRILDVPAGRVRIVLLEGR